MLSSARRRSGGRCGPGGVALSKRATTACNVVVSGGSNSEGLGPSLYASTVSERLHQMLQAYYPTPGVPTQATGTYWPSWITSTSQTGPLVDSAGAGGARSNVVGWGMRSVTLHPSGRTLTGTFTGTSCQVWYSKVSGTQPFTITLDGTVVATIDPNAATSNYHQVWSSGALARGSHTIVITGTTATSGGYINGVAVFDGNETTGIRMWNGGRAGAATTDFAANQARWTAAISDINPDLVILWHAMNDRLNAVPVATTKANLLSIIDAYKTNVTGKTPSFILYADAEISASGFTPIAPWGDYVQAMREIAAADPDVMLIDDYSIMPSLADDPYGLTVDNRHYIDAGADRVARLWMRTLSTVSDQLPSTGTGPGTIARGDDPRIMPAWPSGRYLFSQGSGAPTTSANHGAGTARAQPIIVPADTTLTQFGVEITSAGTAGCTIALGIYADSGSGTPGALLYDLGTVAGDAVATPLITTTRRLPAGRYWLASLVLGSPATVPTLRVLSGPASWWTDAGSATPSAGAVAIGYTHTPGSLTALPATWAVGTTNSVAPRWVLKTA